ncbi:NAD-dependent epimerase/dehydratase family protein [Paenibacillus alkalitolerans]|uniref:NAD-dependent epimerase/dehydratase family protein n=1 Tax=Paenibacillus alkalitolerans TaxID=2799335 RepID=UPI0018F587FE|nr:NAD-dependent epimerase/dehydratase family protein [Paenibacillus alkalitolerans]
MRVFVTGAAGFVGSGILAGLLSKDYHVTCLVRKKPPVAGSYASNGSVRFVEGNLLQPETYISMLAECDAVIHLVGIIRENQGKGVTFERVHTEGTKAIVNACVQSGYAAAGKRFIHMSALGARLETSSGYFRTKWEAEQLVRASGIPHVIFRPSVIFGPGDGFVNMLADLVKLPVTPVIGHGKYRLQPVSLRTVSDVFVKALTHHEVNAAFDIGGPEQISYNDILREIGRAMNRGVRLAHVPLSLMKPAVSLFERFPFFPITGTQLSMLLEENICRDGTPFYDVFKTAPIPLSEGIREYIRPSVKIT